MTEAAFLLANVTTTTVSPVEIPTLDEQLPATVPNDGTSPRNFGETFSCDVDGKHTEITIPADAWDFEHDTVWLTQAQFAELYACSHSNLVEHIGNIYEDEELQEDSTCRNFRQVQLEGNREVSDMKHVDVTETRNLVSVKTTF